MRRPVAIIVAAATALPASILGVAGVSTAAASRALLARRTLGSCDVSLGFVARVISAHEPATAVGELSCPKAEPVAGQPVTLYERPAGSPSYAAVATGTTEASGAYALAAANVTTDSSFYVTAGGVASPAREVYVIAEVTVKGPTEGVVFTRSAHHPPVRFEGTVSPSEKGALVVLQRQNALNGNGWFRIGDAKVTEAGTFTIVHSFLLPGPANIRVLVRDPLVSLASPSNVLNYDITQSENPLVRVTSSADPISYGQSLSVSGTVVGVPTGTEVKLLARPMLGTAFKAAGGAKTDATGGYAFPTQAPTTDTFYKVLAAGKSSALLYEGVKYVLTASISGASSVGLGPQLSFTAEQGQPLTFSGTVKPGVSHHWVYLEREDANHSGFHVVEIGEVRAPEPPLHPEYWYSIPYSPPVSGSGTMRIKIPGDPQNGSTESESFALQITPAPASKLKPGPGERVPPAGQT